MKAQKKMKPKNNPKVKAMANELFSDWPKGKFMDFRTLQTVWLSNLGMDHAPRIRRLKKLKIVTIGVKGNRAEQWTNIQAFYQDGKVLTTAGDVFKAEKINGEYVAVVQYEKHDGDTLCMDTVASRRKAA